MGNLTFASFAKIPNTSTEEPTMYKR